MLDDGLRTGMDLVRVGDVEAALRSHGERYEARLLAGEERRALPQAWAARVRQCALLFAGKEACLKAFDLADQGVGWKEMVFSATPSALGDLTLCGRAMTLSAQKGFVRWVVSGRVTRDYALATVIACRDR